MSPSQDRTIQDRIRYAVLRALRITMEDPSTPLRMGSTPGWDSMGHMAVVLELEKEFHTRFFTYQLPELIDVPSIERMLGKVGAI